MAEFTTKGQGNLNTVLGAIGTAGVTGILGNMGGLFGGNCNTNCGCGDNALVNRYEATQNARIAELETEVKLRDANFYTLSEMGKLRDYVDGKIDGINAQLCAQNVMNAQTAASLACMQGNIATLMGLTKTVVPNTSICPGWGNVTITPTTTTGA